MIVDRFVVEWLLDDNGVLWWYWLNVYYCDRGLLFEDIGEEWFEDIGYVGILLFSFIDFLLFFW